MPLFVAESAIAAPASEVFAWHARPGAFERLTPPWIRGGAPQRTGGLENGARLTFELRVGPFRRRWVALHEAVEPPRQFRDVQLAGPFAAWEHTHQFIDRGPTSLIHDRVDYRLPGGSLAATLGGRWVERRLARLFRFRHARTRQDLERHRRFVDAPPLTVAVSGAGGLVGSNLAAFLSAGGHTVRRLVRGAARGDAGEISYEPSAGAIDAVALEGLDAIVHLAGANIAAGRWTAARRREIRDSRVASTRLLAETLAHLDRPPRVFVCASAIGVYGDRGHETVSETSAPGAGFLADVCRQWEDAAALAGRAGVRVVVVRIGVVLSGSGGALARMLPVFRCGLGGPLGDGRQLLSWIALDDLIGAIQQCLFDETLAGPVNATAPQPVTNEELARTLGRQLRRPALVRTPAPVIRAMFGEMGRALLLGGARVRPEKLGAAGFPFLFPDLASALAFELGSMDP